VAAIKLAEDFQLLKRWLEIVMGKSYYHQPQHLGKAFRPSELYGYFNDLTGKTQWIGLTDEEGVPVNILADGRRVYFATTIAQKALGHWDEWLLNQKEEDRKEFLKLCYWLLSKQDNYGGWPIWSELGLSLSSAYSAMTQGEGISAFVRAWKLTGDETFAKGAKKAFSLMCKPIEEGGPLILEGDNIFLEEAPSNPRSSILNGWIFALFGLYDFWLVFEDKQAYDIFKCSLRSLITHLGQYDTGYWSYYDVQKHLASPFYHVLHINQLEALLMIEHNPTLKEVLYRWKAYQQSKINEFRALFIKAIQKLKEPGEVVVIK